MTERIVATTIVLLLAMSVPAAGQGQFSPTAQPHQPGVQPRQPVPPQTGQGQVGKGPAGQPAPRGQQPGVPRGYAPSANQPAGPARYPEARPEALVPRPPTIERRPPQSPQARQSPPSPEPFTLSAQERALLDWVLREWEKRGAGVKSFDSRFTRFTYDGVFHSDSSPAYVDEGEIRYAAPDKGLYQVKAPREEKWVCDGKSIFEFNYEKKQLIEYQLPPELHGKAISNGPLPFLFGSSAEQLKKRYFLRIVTPAELEEQQIWLEAFPRYQLDAANFLKATLILTRPDMQPYAVETVEPNQKTREAYRFNKPRKNSRNLLDPFGVFENNWLHAPTPRGWTKIVEDPPQSQAARPSRTHPPR